MRKASQEGGDSTSITSGTENEFKKPGGMMKSKKKSIKRKVQSLNHESDDAVIEPLLQKDKEKTNLPNQSAKFDMMSKKKTEVAKDDKKILLQDDKMPKSTVSDTRNDTIISIPISNDLPKLTGVTAPLHNHMNTNVFSNHDALKGLITPKSQILVEINGSKPTGYNPSPLIFTTAKIHTDGKTKHMEPLQVTPVPILSTTEVCVSKGTGINNSVEMSGFVTTNIGPTHAKYTKSNASSEFGIPLKDKIISEIPVATKALNKFAPNNVIESMMSGKVPRSNEIISDGKPTIVSLSQSINTDSLEKTKTITSNGTVKPGVSSIHNEASGTIDQIMKKDKTEVSQKTDINKNINSVESWDLKQSETFDTKPDTNDKNAMNAISIGVKQLQRQKVAIDKDDSATKSNSNTDSLPKSPTQTRFSNDAVLSKSIAHSTSPKSITTTTEAASVSTPVTANKSATSCSTTSVKPTSSSPNNILPLSKIPTTKTTEASNSSTVRVMSTTKSISSATTSGIKCTDSISSRNPQTIDAISSKPAYSATSKPKATVTTTVESLPSSQPTTIVKTVPAISKTTENISKDFAISTAIGKTTSASIGASKVAPVSSITKSPLVVTSTAKSSPVSINTAKNAPVSKNSVKTVAGDNKKNETTSAKIVKNTPASISTVKNSSILIDKVKSTAESTNTTKSMPTSAKTSNVSIDTAAKNTSVPLNTTKNASVLTTVAKSATITKDNLKSTPINTNVSKITPASTTITKNTPITTSNAKIFSETTSVAKNTPVTTGFAKNSSETTSVAKNTPVTTSTAKNSSETTSVAKNTPVTTSIAKNSSETTSVAKNIPVTTSTAKNSSETTSVAKNTPVSTSIAKNSSETTSVAKNTPVTTSIAKNSSETASVAKNTPVTTSIAKNSSETTSVAKNTFVSPSTTMATSKSNVVLIGKVSVTSPLSTGTSTTKITTSVAAAPTTTTAIK